MRASFVRIKPSKMMNHEQHSQRGNLLEKEATRLQPQTLLILSRMLDRAMAVLQDAIRVVMMKMEAEANSQLFKLT